MKRYAIVFENSVPATCASHLSGVAVFRESGKHNNGGRQLRTAVSRQHAIVLKGFALAPEDDEFSEEIQMSFSRYQARA
jgi:hypothetical protein